MAFFNDVLPYLKARGKQRPATSRKVKEDDHLATSKPYQYDRLSIDQIRVLSISEDSTTGVLVCNFHVTDLPPNQFTYRAISYCWGDPMPTHRVLCSNGQSLCVTKSAADLLTFVVPQNETYYFWIDQLCINQSDLTEKSQQVQMMGKIYASAKEVIAWLGRGDKREENAFAFVESMFEEIEDMKCKGLHPTLLPSLSLPARVRHVKWQIQTTQQWKALSHLLRNPWFERIWVMQEVIMASAQFPSRAGEDSSIILSIQKHSISFEKLSCVFGVLEQDHLHSNLIYDQQNKDGLDEIGMDPPGFDAVQIFSAYRAMRKEGTPVLLNSALSNAWHFKASDDRDKLYAVMGFVTEQLDRDLFPQYECTVEDVYVAWATKLLERENDYPMLLHMAGIGLQRSHESLPSWVPDFSSRSFEVQLGSAMTRKTRGKHYRASGPSERAGLKVHPESPTLRFQGMIIDTIFTSFPQPSAGKSDRWYHNLTPSMFFTPDKKFHRSFLQWIDDILYLLRAPSPAVGQNDPPPMEVLWQTIVGDYPTKENPLDSDLRDSFDCWYQAQRELAGKDKSNLLASFSRKPEIYDKAQEFEDLKAGALHDRPIFGTAQHHLLGHGPKGLQAGDSICIIKGVITPFLLRPDTDRSGEDGTVEPRWSLVGDCFVHSLMYGEGLNMAEMGELVIT